MCKCSVEKFETSSLKSSPVARSIVAANRPHQGYSSLKFRVEQYRDNAGRSGRTRKLMTKVSALERPLSQAVNMIHCLVARAEGATTVHKSA
jgi:hypothetical protein